MLHEAILLKFEFRGSVKQAKCDIELSPGYAGLPIIYLTDKLGHNHTFVRGNYDGWSRLGKAPDWPSDFLATLCAALEKEYQKIST